MAITFPQFDERELENVKACLESKWVTQGPFSAEFERRFADRHELNSALTTTSCTAALHLACLALELGPDDEVIVPAFTWITSANCAEYVGAKVVFADIDLETFNFDPEALKAAITPRTRAIVAVHLFGLAAPMDEILAITAERGIHVIEDAACAVGSTYRGKPVGGLGDIGCFSFHPRKVITTGEGGMVTTNDAELANRIGCLRNHGASQPPGPQSAPGRPYSMGAFETLGFNLRMSDIQAAVGVAQMDKLDGLLDQRRLRAERYTQLLTAREMNDLKPPTAPDGCGHSYQSYVVRLRVGGQLRRNQVMDCLADEGIQTRPGTHAVHRLGYYVNKYDIRAEDFPNAKTAEETTITLPIFPGMTDADQDRVVDSLRHALHKSGQAAA
ncbi:MAG: DegT/DnrJ/EryC1/StrS family aminotransferase [Planctomycetaceae bacterium]|nr:DegT/DnrJ/EryC1/StrS family aminotransferase [Planctomycetaceae bacterium]MBT6156016.1 DegT/DnrJ/EryC1/StrS family aminotransferase [Planctomycetaceae bacterium]MBT6487543.1 DegT/DnrJ/EryC1/StrS family aminotransferase [Planctomycetaceae bacterium]MBT6498204.1 DegT/DnrJ/EryC1/StrS family aminotransferase [Planctomycetaceae bacterium]